MREKIYNIFLFTDGKLITSIGAVEHFVSGNDEQKLRFLQNEAQNDSSLIKNFRIPDSFQHIDDNDKITKGVLRLSKYRDLVDVGKSALLFAEVFDFYNSPATPLFCVSFIVNGELKIEGEFLPLPVNNTHYKEIHFYSGRGYLEKYYDSDGFHVNSLIIDDFLDAIKMLINSGHYIEATKLLLSSIDSFAFLEFGDVNKSFIKWVNAYIDFKVIHVTAEELWELRNAILHMTSYDSRKVKQGKVSRLILQMGTSPNTLSNKTFDGKYLNIQQLFTETSKAAQNWIGTLLEDVNKLKMFIERYNLIISNSRLDKIELIK